MKAVAHARRTGQRGSALLIVLVMAAIIAIALYKEIPVAAFEARRQKEQLLIDRGNQYKRAVRLFIRRFGTYPPSIDAMVNTNNVRFLRRRYVDPFTQKEDWRLLHAGPGGVIVDSKVKAPIDGASTPSDEQPASAGTAVRSIPARAPAIAATHGDGSGEGGGVSEAGPSAPLLLSGEAARLTDNSPGAVDAAKTDGAGSDTALSNPAGSAGAGSFGGGIAGVASVAQGHSILLVHKQSDYSLWEFYYDPLVDGDVNLQLLRTPVEGINGNGAPGTGAAQAPPTGSGSSNP